MESVQVTLAICVACLLVLTQSAPLQKKESDVTLALQPTAETLSIEDALRALTQGTELPPKPIVNGISYSESKTETETNINGHKTGHSASETKIAKPSGKVVADVKTKTNAKQDGDQEPEIESEVVVPDQAEDGQQGISPSLNPLDYSPRAVAEYLLATGDYAGVMAGFQSLVDSGKITSEAATMDIEAVMSEYSELVNEMQEAERVDEPVYYDEPAIDPTTEELAELYLMNERLREEEELAERMQEPAIEDFVPEVAEEEVEDRMNEAALRQSLTTLIDRIYDDLEAGNQNLPVDTLTESNEDLRAASETHESRAESETERAEQEARAETEALESLSSVPKNEKKTANKKNTEEKDEKNSSQQKSA